MHDWNGREIEIKTYIKKMSLSCIFLDLFNGGTKVIARGKLI